MRAGTLAALVIGLLAACGSPSYDDPCPEGSRQTGHGMCEPATCAHDAECGGPMDRLRGMACVEQDVCLSQWVGMIEPPSRVATCPSVHPPDLNCYCERTGICEHSDDVVLAEIIAVVLAGWGLAVLTFQRRRG